MTIAQKIAELFNPELGEVLCLDHEHALSLGFEHFNKNGFTEKELVELLKVSKELAENHDLLIRCHFSSDHKTLVVTQIPQINVDADCLSKDDLKKSIRSQLEKGGKFLEEFLDQLTEDVFQSNLNDIQEEKTRYLNSGGKLN